MKTTVINVQCENLTISHEAVLEFLKKHSSRVDEIYLGSFTQSDTIPTGPEVLVYFPLDEEEPAVIVKKLGDVDGYELSSVEYGLLMASALCIGLYAEYPDADKYGTPTFVQSEAYAKSWAVATADASHISQNFSLEWLDRGDDSGTNVWLKLRKQG